MRRRETLPGLQAPMMEWKGPGRHPLSAGAAPHPPTQPHTATHTRFMRTPSLPHSASHPAR